MRCQREEVPAPRRHEELDVERRHELLEGHVPGERRRLRDAEHEAGTSALICIQWNGFSGTALRTMNFALANRALSVCGNQGSIMPVRPFAMDC